VQRAVDRRDHAAEVERPDLRPRSDPPQQRDLTRAPGELSIGGTYQQYTTR
jgi:hypothetical protein